jgi:hypothetical protein
MVDLVRLTQSPEIDVVGFVKPLKSLVNEHVVNHKIGNAIEGDADANVEHEAIAFYKIADKEKEHGHTGKHHEKVVIFFKEMFRLVMMILMQVPEQTMHNVLVRKPGYTFHQAKCNDDNSNIKQGLHVLINFLVG